MKEIEHSNDQSGVTAYGGNGTLMYLKSKLVKNFQTK